MAPILHIMRHGQGYHSEAVTKNGSQRCKEFPHHDRIELLLASPLRRALETSKLTFAPCIARGLRILALPMAEEASDAPCDTGSEVEILKQEFPDLVDFDHVKQGWYFHESEYAVDPKSLNARAAKLRRFIRDRPESEVALVSHGFFNHYLTGDVNEQGEQTTPWWQETELRTFVFVDGHGEDAMIKETEESLMQRGQLKDGLIINRPEERGKVAVPS